MLIKQQQRPSGNCHHLVSDQSLALAPAVQAQVVQVRHSRSRTIKLASQMRMHNRNRCNWHHWIPHQRYNRQLYQRFRMEKRVNRNQKPYQMHLKFVQLSKKHAIWNVKMDINFQTVQPQSKCTVPMVYGC